MQKVTVDHPITPPRFSLVLNRANAPGLTFLFSGNDCSVPFCNTRCDHVLGSWLELKSPQTLFFVFFGMFAFENGRQDLLCRMLRSLVDVATTPTPDTVSATPPAPAHVAPSPNMSAEVNVSAVNLDSGPNWWHAYDE